MDLALKALRQGVVIPACPLALNAARKFDERRQRALVRYYSAAGAGGLAVGVHTTQFAIRDPKIGLFPRVLEFVGEELKRSKITVRIGGVCGPTAQAVHEAELLKEWGYHAGLLSLSAMKDVTDEELIDHCRRVAQTIPVVGFYLQPAAGGRLLSYDFWRRFVEIENVIAIKVAPFNRYQTIDVVRAVVESGRDEIALYTGNDDNIAIDLVTPFRFEADGKMVERRIVGGLLGHWAVWTHKAVRLLDECHRAAKKEEASAALLRRNIEVTDANAAFFDAANGFAGCIAGIHEVLRRQGLLEGIWCLDPNETLSRGQAEEIDRVYRAYPHLNDDTFVRQHVDQWLR
jgi:dihydrodipicolinate synthase/N-acetylneuraminate lyase